MTDLEIIKELEKELRTWAMSSFSNLSDNYILDSNSDVIEIDLENHGITVIPQSLLLLKNLKKINLSGNEIDSISELLILKKLEVLSIEGCWEISDKSFEQFTSQSKSIKHIFHYDSFTHSVFPKTSLNHNLNIYGLDISDRELEGNVLTIADMSVFPPQEMLELGYRNPKFYYNNYLPIIEEYLTLSNKNRPKKVKEARLASIKSEIKQELIECFYQKYTKKRELKYAVRKIGINRYHDLYRILIDNISTNAEAQEISDPQWVFITGDNGYGKTSLLQATVIGLFGNKDKDQILNDLSEIFLEFKNDNKYQVNGSDELNEDNNFNHFAAYGPARLNSSMTPSNNTKTASLFNPHSELLDIEVKLIQWNNKNQIHFQQSAIEILKKLLSPQIKNIQVIQDKTDTAVKYYEFGDNKGKDFRQLASGYRSLITMVGDIMIRLIKHQSEITNFSDLAGIVVIDEIDLHLHPKWQKAMVEKLTQLFPKIQFIASTHSPIPILGAPKDSVIINVQRDENGITAEKLDINFSTLLPNSILTSPIFGFEDIIPTSKSKDEFLNTEPNYTDIEHKEQTQKDIKELLTPEKKAEFLKILNQD